jgi:hypothetical protein
MNDVNPSEEMDIEEMKDSSGPSLEGVRPSLDVLLHVSICFQDVIDQYIFVDGCMRHCMCYVYVNLCLCSAHVSQGSTHAPLPSSQNDPEHSHGYGMYSCFCMFTSICIYEFSCHSTDQLIFKYICIFVSESSCAIH